MEMNTIYNESCLTTLARMENESIDCVITSPPYYQLRDYGYAAQWGLEPTFQEYLEHLWQMMDEVYRVLKPTGSAWINLGDTYTGSNGFGTNQNNWKTGDPYSLDSKKSDRVKIETLPPKCLLLIPHRFAIGCIDRGWIVRNDCVWAKRNAMPESVTDRFSKKHEYFFFMIKQGKYYFDLDVIRDILKNPVSIRNKASEIYGRGSGSKQFSEGERIWGDEEKGKNPGSVSDFWDIPTKPSSDEHYAQYNDELLKKPILAGCPKGGIIYDPFCGTGTTIFTAMRANRNAIGSELGPKYYNDAIRELNLVKSQMKLAL